MDLTRARDIFDRAVAADPAEREALVRRDAGENAALARFVLDMLAEHAAAERQATIGAGLRRPVRDLVGTEVGPYRLLEPIGEGGFGTVWLAERRVPMVQRVALKIIKPGMDSKSVVARFEQERQALAIMDHPNVAKVFDGGVTDRGLPYFVMEYVSGEPITDFCDRHRLTIRQRLEVFATVCDAVQHAHQKGIIHRDIKPSNVLLQMVEDRPLAKVIDFGVAKAMADAVPGHSIVTQEGAMIGTPEYMSPEQVAGLADVDTRTDVYSLGVLLYQLLAGELPFDSRALRSGGLAEAQRIIRETPAPKPSTRLGSVEDALRTAIADRRGTGSDRLQSELRRELDWIPLKAIRKERERRYASPEALAADLRRYLDGRPLEAAPESRVYLARKFLRRNRVLVTTALLIFAAIFVGGGVAAWQWRAAAIERDATRRLLSFVSTAVDDAAGELDSGATIPIPEPRLDAAREEFERDFAVHPGLLAPMRVVFARAYLSAGLPARALELLPAADAPPPNLPALDPAALRCEALYRLRRGDDAVAALEPYVRSLERALGAHAATDLALAERKRQLAAAFKWSGRFPESRREFDSALQIFRSNPNADPIHVIRTQYDLVLLRHSEIKKAERPDAPDRLSVEAAARERAVLEQTLSQLANEARLIQPESVDALKCDFERVRIRYAQGFKNEAADELRALLPEFEDAFGTRSFRTLEARVTLGQWETERDHFEIAIEVLDRAYRGYRAAQGFSSRDTAIAGASLAIALGRADHVDRALVTFREALIRTAEKLPKPADLAGLADQAAKWARKWQRSDEADFWTSTAAQWRAEPAASPARR